MAHATTQPIASPTPVTYMADASISRFTVAQYQRMIETGILNDEDKVELLEGYVVRKMPRNPLHDGTIGVIDEYLRTVIPPGWRVRCQLTVVLSDSQPEPDFAVARGDVRTYLTRHPTVADVGLVVEVADSSLLRDQRDKTRIYARAGVACYWIINLVDRRVEVYTQPSGPTAAPAYGAFQTFQPGDTVPLVLDGNTVASVPVADFLP
jgi:Uma2 family endonuclease